MKKTILFSMAIAAVSLFGSCANDVEIPQFGIRNSS